MNKYFFLFVLLLLFALQTLSQRVEAQSNQAVFLYQPDSGSIETNSNLTLDFRVNASSAITSIKSSLTFDPTRLLVVSIDSSTSSFGTQWEQVFDNTEGTISIQRSAPTPGVSGDKLIAKINFQTKSTIGTATLGYDPNCFSATNPSCLALKPDDTNILVESNGATFTITSAPTPTPTTPGPTPSSNTKAYYILGLFTILLVFMVIIVVIRRKIQIFK